jgi:cyclophilin family peptidyl-prolyl cis-trans isomerase
MVGTHGEWTIGIIHWTCRDEYVKVFSRLLGSVHSFGYVVEGSDFLQDIKEGDVIVSAKVTDGLQYLKSV